LCRTNKPSGISPLCNIHDTRCARTKPPFRNPFATAPYPLIVYPVQIQQPAVLLTLLQNLVRKLSVTRYFERIGFK
jgi:hypothetical protein